jgi:DNA-binding transcriptional LysR family regulator
MHSGSEIEPRLADFRCFLSVAQTGNIGTSAFDLRASAPAVSTRLRKLEENLGVQLFIRRGHEIVLTSAGTCLRDRASTAIRLLTSPLASRAPDRTPETISLGVTAELGRIIVPFLANASRLRWPNLRLEIKEGVGSVLEEWLIAEHIDLAVLDDPPTLAELVLMPVLKDKLGLVASIYSDLGPDARALPLDELAHFPLILPCGQHALRRSLDRVTRQRGVRLSPILQVDSVAMITSLVRSEIGFSIMPYALIHAEIACGGLAFHPIKQPCLTFNSSIAFHRTATPSGIQTTFAEMIRLAITAFANEGAWRAELVADR